ncbi:MAG: GNAT family N-acetyltransferase, partial [Sciscionella sp.]
FIDHRVRATGLDRRRLGGEIWGYDDGDHGIVALCHAAANLVPAFAAPDALAGFATQVLSRRRQCSAILGPDYQVAELWRLVSREWGPARSIRPHQPFLALSSPPLVEPSPYVRRVRPHELDVLHPACVAMFREEVGVSPEIGGGGAAYRARVAQLIAGGMAFAHIEGNEVLFKAEIGAATPSASQVQGVWVNPRYRGQGLGTSGMAAVARTALAEVAPVVTLYVNEHNEAARRVYSRVGFTEHTRFATVLF